MIACVDAYYGADKTRVAAVTFAGWQDCAASREVEEVPAAAPYEPGEFYKRELPPLLHVLGKIDPPDILIVDSFAWLGPGRPGLGARLHEAVSRRCPVVGVAKNPFLGSPGVEVRRHGTRPLWVTAAGMEPGEAARCVASMHGPHRIPTLLKRVDDLSRGNVRPR